MENPKLEKMGSQKISVSDEHTSSTKPADSFVVDMERFSHLLERDVTANSRIKLQRSLSRKGSVRNGERKTNPNAANENPIATSPRAALHGASTPEKLTVVTVGATDNSAPQPHNQITIMAGGATPAESKIGGRRFSFRRPSSPSWTIDPRRIVLFFATLFVSVAYWRATKSSFSLSLFQSPYVPFLLSLQSIANISFHYVQLGNKQKES